MQILTAARLAQSSLRGVEPPRARRAQPAQLLPATSAPKPRPLQPPRAAVTPHIMAKAPLDPESCTPTFGALLLQFLGIACQILGDAPLFWMLHPRFWPGHPWILSVLPPLFGHHCYSSWALCTRSWVMHPCPGCCTPDLADAPPFWMFYPKTWMLHLQLSSRKPIPAMRKPAKPDFKEPCADVGNSGYKCYVAQGVVGTG